jgi:hypothetical protein
MLAGLVARWKKRRRNEMVGDGERVSGGMEMENAKTRGRKGGYM